MSSSNHLDRSPATWPSDGLEYLLRCPVCGHKDYSALYQDLVDHTFGSPVGPWGLQTCHGCESAFLSPRPSEASIHLAYQTYYTHGDLDSVSKESEHSLSESNEESTPRGHAGRPSISAARQLVKSLFLFVPVLRWSVQNSNRHLPRASRGNDQLLDVGCGDGSFMHLAQRLGWKAEGIDTDERAIAVCLRNGLDAKVGDINTISSEPKLYDVVTCSHVIEHIHDPSRFLNLLSSKIRPGGILWLETPNIQSLGHRRFENYWRGLEPPRHLVLFNVDSLREMLQPHGFDVEQMPWNFRQVHNVYRQSGLLNGDDLRPIPTARLSRAGEILIDSMREWLRPSVREFITIKAVKR